MKRPFAVIGFTSFAVMLFSALIGRSDVALYACKVCAASGVLSLIDKNLRQTVTVPVCLFTASAVCFLFVMYNGDRAQTQSLTGDSVEVKATVSEAPYMKKTNGRHYCVLELESVDGEKASGKLRLSFSPSKDGIETEQLDIGNKVSFTGKVYIPGENEKSISRYFTGENILLGAYGVTDFTWGVPVFRGVNYYFHKIRSFVSERLRYGFGDKIAGLLVGILTGDKSVLDDELYDAFRDTGIAHLMAVSGLHLSVWVYSLGSLIPEKSKTAKLKYVLLIFAVLFIMLLAGMSESVKRAGFMSLVYLSGKLSSHRSDSLNSLGFAVFVMILFNPMCVLSISLQLSFLSTLGILTLGQLYIKRSSEILGGRSINTPFKRFVRACSDIFFISISVLVFTFPVLIYNFGGISTVSAWVNMLVSHAVTPLLMLSGAYVLLSGLPWIAFPVSVIVKLISEYVISVASVFLRVKNAFLVFNAENLPLYIAAAVLIAFLSLAFFKRSNAKARMALILSSVIASVGLIAFYEKSEEAVKIHLADYDGQLAVAVENYGTALLTENIDSYERGLFISGLEEKGADTVAYIDGEDAYSLSDGKALSKAEYDADFKDIGIKAYGDGKIIEAEGKYIHIFYSETLQKADSCDIIITKRDGGAVISSGEKSFTLEKGGSLTLILKDNLILRGEGSWRNLMKSN